MSLTLKILFALDAFFAVVLVVYLCVSYTKLFNRKPEIFASKKENGEEIEVSYEEEPCKPLKSLKKREEAKEQAKTEPLDLEKKEEVKEEIQDKPQDESGVDLVGEEKILAEKDTLTIGSIEELEDKVKSVAES